MKGEAESPDGTEDPLIPAASGPRGSREPCAGHPESRIAQEEEISRENTKKIGSRRGPVPRRYEGRTADALAQGADEGRGKPR